MTPDLLPFAKLAHEACALTTRFILGYAPQVEAATAVADNCTEANGVRPQTIRGYYSRTVAWMESINKLGNAGDVQAVTVAARALFEAQVDLVLLHHAPADHPAQKIFDWERSAVLKHAEKVVRFFKGKGVPVPVEYSGMPEFLVGVEAPLIRAARVHWWQRDQHPGRWTGCGLEQDAKRADQLSPDAKLDEFYQLEYSPTCWGTHGSSLAGLRSRSPVLVVAAYASQLMTVQHLALLNARLVLEEVGLFLKVPFDDLQNDIRRRVGALELAGQPEKS